MPGLSVEDGGRAGGGTPEVDLDPPDRAGRRRRGGPSASPLREWPCGRRRTGAVKDLHQPDGGGIRRTGRTRAQPGKEILRGLARRARRADAFGTEDHWLAGQAFGLTGAEGVAQGAPEGGLPIICDRIDQGGHGLIIAENQA